MMTKKHFEAIADILSAHFSVPAITTDQLIMLDQIAADLGHYFESENDRFDLDKFILRYRGIQYAIPYPL